MFKCSLYFENCQTWFTWLPLLLCSWVWRCWRAIGHARATIPSLAGVTHCHNHHNHREMVQEWSSGNAETSSNSRQASSSSVPCPQLCPPPRCRISQSIWRRMLWCFKHRDDLKNADTVSKKYLPQRMFRDPDSGQENDWGHSWIQWASHRIGPDLAWRWCNAAQSQSKHGTNPAPLQMLQIFCWIVTWEAIDRAEALPYCQHLQTPVFAQFSKIF